MLMLCAFHGSAALTVNAAVPPFRFAAAFGDGMVLAASPRRAMIWGFCPTGATVEVSFKGQALKARIGPDQGEGRLTTWRALLPDTTASFAKHTINVTSAGSLLRLNDVMFGEVWVCSASSEETKYEFGMHAPTGVRDARGGWMGGDVLEPCTLHVPAPSAALELYGYHRSPHPAASRGRRGAGLPRDRGPDADRRRATGTARLS